MNFKRIHYLKKLPRHLVYADISSPVGILTLLASDAGLHMILWDNERNTIEATDALSHFQHEPQHPIIQETQKQFSEYFAKQRTTFTIPLCIEGTAFQKLAWQALQQIPFGKTISYAQQATQLGDKNKARAVGMANGMNPISIIIPCHRVIGSNGKLTGFAGGFDKKLFLLHLEKSV